MAVRSLLSRVRLTSPDGAQTIAWSIKSLSDDHVEGYINGVQDTGMTVGSNDVTFAATVSIGDEILIKRVTPPELANQTAVFTDGSVVSDIDFDNLQTQLLYLVQETMDDALESAYNREADAELDCGAKVVKNASDGVDGSDLVTKDQLDAVAISGTDLPAPGSNDSFMVVNGGAWQQRTKAQVQAHLSLDTAAYVATGTTSGTVPLHDSNDKIPRAAMRPERSKLLMNTSAVTNSTSGTWLTDSSGTLYRMGGGTLVTYHDPDGNFTVNNPTHFTCNNTGTYRMRWTTMVRNAHASAVAEVLAALTNADGTTEHFPEISFGTLDHGAGGGDDTWQTFIIEHEIALTAGDELYFRIKNNAASGTVNAWLNGTHCLMERVA